MDDIDLAQSLRGSLGGGTTARRVSSPTTTTTIAGTATCDSANGVVSVRIDGQGTGTGDDGSTEIATTTNVREGDRVIVTLVGADGTGKHPVVTGVVGRGDEMQQQIEDAASSGGLRIFTEQPTPPYDRGDLWAMASTSATGDYGDAEAQTIGEHEDAGTTWGSLESYEGRTVYVCTTAKAAGESFDAADWSETVDWTGHYVTNSRLERTDDRITAEVSARTEITDQLGQAVAQKADTSTVQQTAQDLTATFTTALNGKADKTIIRESGAGVEVGKVDSNGAYTSGRTKLDEDSFDILSKSGETIASYGASKVELGKNSAAAVIELCNGNGRISTANTWTSIESPKTGNLELKSGVGTEQQAFVRVSGGDRPQISLVRTDGIADANSVIQMSGSGITINGGEKGVKIGHSDTAIKNIVCGSSVVTTNHSGDADIISAQDAAAYGCKYSGSACQNACLIACSSDMSAFSSGYVTPFWVSSGHYWAIHVSASNTTMRVNWTLFVW